MSSRTVLLLLTLAPAMGAQTPPSQFETPGCNTECCSFGTWRAKTRTIAFAKRDSTSSKAFVVQPNDSVEALSGLVSVQQPGVYRVSRSWTVRARSYPKGGAWQDITVAAGDTLYTFWESAEATDAVIWYRGSLYSSEYPQTATQLSPLRTRWWVHIRNRRGQLGWVLEPWPTFDGTDVCQG